jgi:hypothetical protein
MNVLTVTDLHSSQTRGQRGKPFLYFKESWKRALRTKAYPSFLRHVIRMDAKEFVAMVQEADQKSADDLVGSVIAGDAYVLKNAHAEEEVDSLRQRIVEWKNARKQDSFDQIREGCSDFHKIYDVEREGKNFYKTCNHTYEFYRWNGDPLKIFSMITPYWEAIKVLSGHHPEAFLNATPKDGTIDKLAIYQYPMSFGRVTKHYDPPADQKLLLNLPMGKIGRDYGFGEYGFYAVDGDSRKNVFLEHVMNFGDSICLCPTVHHGAEPAHPINRKPDTTPDWESDRGRWLLTALSTPSHEVKNRMATVAVND